jgi:hypothetical protein
MRSILVATWSRAVSAIRAAKHRLAPPREVHPKRRSRPPSPPQIPALPEGARYPREGYIYEATDDVPIMYLTHYFDLPYTGGGDAILPKGERVRVAHVRGEKPLGVSCDPLRYDELHARIVSEEERASDLYRGYHLAITTADLNTSFRLVRSDSADAQENGGK